MLIRIGFWLSAVALIALELGILAVFLMSKNAGDDPLPRGFAAGLLSMGVPAVVTIWLGVFLASLVRKGWRLAH